MEHTNGTLSPDGTHSHLIHQISNQRRSVTDPRFTLSSENIERESGKEFPSLSTLFFQIHLPESTDTAPSENEAFLSESVGCHQSRDIGTLHKTWRAQPLKHDESDLLLGIHELALDSIAIPVAGYFHKDNIWWMRNFETTTALPQGFVILPLKREKNGRSPREI